MNTPAFSTDVGKRYLAAYESCRSQSGAAAARQALRDALAQASEMDWLACVRALVLRGDADTARALLVAARSNWPDSIELRFALAGLLMDAGEPVPAEALLHELLARQPGHTAAVFLLARLLGRQGRMHAAATVVRALFESGPQDTETLIQAVELLDDFGRKQDAAAICEAEIAAGCTDPRVHAYAGMLGIQLGQFERVRERYSFALTHSPQAVEWNIPIGLAGLQRYRDGGHADFQLFREALQRPDLSERARALTLFALGKACDDIAEYAQAAHLLRAANALAHARSTWSRKNWRRAIEARLAAKPPPFRLPDPIGWTPLFIVGVPRSGTTLLAELLARHPAICHRGELGWLGRLARQLEQAGTPRLIDFEQAAATYATQLRQDDSSAQWFIDKQPLNLLHIDLILALWPNARIVYCLRNPRDTALSLWSQSFHDHAHDYAYDLDDIAAVIQGCERLMSHWRKRYETAIRTVRYEELATDPERCLSELARWLGLPEQDQADAPGRNRVIGTASAWQARQPVYTRSVARWHAYAPHIPELLRLPGP